jgi:ADP-dependent NAD(P)H-hydrate dehydratase / NAD(P)H-hydrate epimerase
MIPVVTPDEMAEVDRAAAEPVDVLVERAGFRVALAARRLLVGASGRRVVVVAGRGNNGADGRLAARFLTGWGAAVGVLEASSLAPAESLPVADLVIDAAYGTGLSRPYLPPDPGEAPVLAVDIPSGLSGLTGRRVGGDGEAGGGPDGGGPGGGALTAVRTVTFAAYKPGLLIGDGPDYAGEVEVADIGLEELVRERARTWVVTDDAFRALPGRPRQTHKWATAVEVVGGSPAMNGAPLMVAHGAMRAGAGYALVGVPGAPPGGGLPPGEHVGITLPEHGWEIEAAAHAKRARALVVGPGLGHLSLGPDGRAGADSSTGRLLAAAPTVPAVVDADGLTALADVDSVRRVVEARAAPTVLTPHEGEFARLVGRPPADDRIADVRDMARRSGAVFLLKGSPTVVAHPDGRVLVVTAGSSRLATAGTGDVLSGIIGAFLARGAPALEAAALGAHCHGRAAGLGRREGLVASDLPELVSQWLSDSPWTGGR